jgi:hypothetical protein
VSDQELLAIVHRAVAGIKDGSILRHSERVKVDGFWIVVRVMEADNQRDVPGEEVAR